MSDLSFVNKKGLKIYTQKWLPQKEIKSCILLLHGYAEYSRRYYKFIQRLNDSGHAVFALDYQGHGRSEGVRGSVDGFNDLVEDAAYFLSAIYQDYEEEQWFAAGHGLGGNIALKLASLFPDYFSGVILSAPAIMMDHKIPRVVQEMARNIASVYSNMPVMRLDTRYVSRDTDVVKGYNKDPLVYHGGLRAGMALCFQEAAKEVIHMLGRINTPVWIGHGAADRMNDPEGSHYIMNHIGSEDKTLSVFDHLFHEILNEPERETVIDEIMNWIETRTAVTAGMYDHYFSGQRTG